MASQSAYWLTRFCFQRALGGIYCVAFAIAINQFQALCGRRGLLPVPLFLKDVSFWDAPSLLWNYQSNEFIAILAWLGLALAIFATLGFSDAFGTSASIATWFALWLIYSSFVNVGQTFYGFGWESLLLETGFLVIFMGPSGAPPSFLLILLLRWLLFRLMFGAGLIKLRGDECWRDLTCMKYHYETMPLPGPLTWFFHRLPTWLQKGSVLFNHFTELIVPFFYFGPRGLRHAAGLITFIFQIILIVSGNFSWLNHLTLVVAIACFDDSWLRHLGNWLIRWAHSLGVDGLVVGAEGGINLGSGVGHSVGIPSLIIYGLTGLVSLLSLNPILNLLSKRQAMNRSFEPFHIVNTYGAFGSITRIRNEIILEGANDRSGPWLAFEFKGKPGDVGRRPPQVSPYHYKLDWQMWFAAMSPYNYNPWILNLVAKLLSGDEVVLGLMGTNPFSAHPPKFIRASLYEYHFSDPGEAAWWKREYVGEYLPPLSLDNSDYRELLNRQGWLDLN